MSGNLQQLYADQQAIAAQIAAAVRPMVEEARAALTSESVTALVEQLVGIQAGLPGGRAKEQIGNAITVLTAVPNVLDSELADLDTLIASHAPPASPEGDEGAP